MQGFWNLIGKAGQGPGKDFQYVIGEKVSSSLDSKSVWTLHHGKKRSNGDIVSIFACDGKTCSPDELHLAKTAHKRLKTLRHPNIIKYLDGFESETLVYVVTEPVIPLLTFLDEEDGRNANLITWGLHQVTSGLSFLINNGNLAHENVNIYSIFVGLDGEWKLGGVEYVHATNTDSVAKLPYLARYDPPEGKNSRKKEIWSTDAWGLGCLIWEIYNGALQTSSDLKVIAKIPKPLIIHYCDLVSANPKTRSNPKTFLEKTSKPGQFLNNDFIKANLFLQEIQIKGQDEQKEFFISLDKSLDGFPKPFCVHKVLPQLLNAFEYGSAGSAVLSPLFKVGLLLDDAEYQVKILPCIIKLFSSNDRATRIQLLQQMEKFVKHLQASVVDNQIFACVATGFGDTLPAMREQTVKAMLLLAPKLSEKTLSNQLLRYFAKLQMDEQPGIRTNTTVCLGKIAQYLSKETRQKVLIPAFARAIRDPFPPARSAGIMAIAATKEYYSMPDIAMKLLPALCGAALDPERSVRTNVFIVIKMFLSNLEDYSTNPESPLNNTEAAEKEAQNQGSTWTGWAVSSLTSRFYQSPQTANNKTNSTPAPLNIPEDKQQKDHKTAQKPCQNIPQHKDTFSNSTQDDSDRTNYEDTWEDEPWEDAKDDFVSMKADMLSARNDLLSFTKNESGGMKNTETNNDSDSDYGDWGADDDGWRKDNDDWGVTPYEDQKKKLPSSKTPLKLKQLPSQSKEEKSVAELLGMDSGGVDFLTGQKMSSKSTDDWSNGGLSPIESQKTKNQCVSNSKQLSASKKSKTIQSKTNNMDDMWQNNDFSDGSGWGNDDSGTGWDTSDGGWDGNTLNNVGNSNKSSSALADGWGDDTNWEDETLSNSVKSEQEIKKEKRKQALLKKREERKLQRELVNKDKITKSGSGALKLGAVKKVNS